MQLVTQVIRGLKTGWLQSKSFSTLPANAPIVLFFHGFPDSPYNWRYQMEALAEDAVVVAPFLRGVGASDFDNENEGRISVEANALDCLDILRTLDVSAQRPIYIVGHDIGSLYAWNVARILGQRLKGLIIINGASPEQMAKRLTNINQVKRSWYIAAIQIPILSEKVFKHFGEELVAKQRTKEGLSHQPISEQTIHAFFKHYRSLTRTSCLSVLRKTKKVFAPVLVLSGKDDPYLLPPTASEIENLAVQPIIRVVEGGHWLHEQHPEYINKKIREFISEHH